MVFDDGKHPCRCCLLGLGRPNDPSPCPSSFQRTPVACCCCLVYLMADVCLVDGLTCGVGVGWPETRRIFGTSRVSTATAERGALLQRAGVATNQVRYWHRLRRVALSTMVQGWLCTDKAQKGMWLSLSCHPTGSHLFSSPVHHATCSSFHPLTRESGPELVATRNERALTIITHKVAQSGKLSARKRTHPDASA